MEVWVVVAEDKSPLKLNPKRTAPVVSLYTGMTTRDLNAIKSSFFAIRAFLLNLRRVLKARRLKNVLFLGVNLLRRVNLGIVDPNPSSTKSILLRSGLTACASRYF